jgi:methionyl-tRNA formyltransferase
MSRVDSAVTDALRVTIFVDNPSWILPYAERLAAQAAARGCAATLARSADDVPEGDVAFFLGCTTMASRGLRARNRMNMVVHESALPHGRGFAPLAWQVLEGRTEIPVVLFEAEDAPDAGPIYLRDRIQLTGYELNDELRRRQGEVTVSLCLEFLERYPDLRPEPQIGAATTYRRRTPQDSALDPDKSLRQQWPLLRVVDNERYPAFVDIDGHRYILKIYPAPKAE